MEAAACPKIAEPPVAAAPPRWTLKRLVCWIQEKLELSLSRESIRQALHRLGYCWKKAKKLLNRADTAKREAFLERLRGLLDKVLHHGGPLIVYLDEAHIHEDADLGYGWAKRGEPFLVGSHSPGLSAKVSFYGLYIYNEGKVHVWPYPRANSNHTCEVLKRLRELHPRRPLQLIWDGASYHRSVMVKELAKELSITLIPLPGYSPDFMPVEHLWNWLREDVTYHHCHTSDKELIDRVSDFVQRINQNPCEVADRLWVTDHLNPEEEKLRASA